MLFRIGFLALFLFSTSGSPAIAQAENAPSLDQAFALANNGEFEAAIGEVERIINVSEEVSDRFNALMLFSDIRLAQGRPSEAAQLAESAANLAREQAPDQIDAILVALDKANQAYYGAGDRDNWFRISTEIMAFQIAEVEDHWGGDGEPPIHRLTQLRCPPRLATAVRQEFSVLESNGTDVVCQYVFAERLNTRVSIYMTYHSADRMQGDVFASTQQQIETAFHQPRLRERDQLEVNGARIDYAIYQRDDTTTATWLTVDAGWALKIRITHYGDVETEEMQAVAEALYDQMPGISAHLSSCSAITDHDAEITTATVDDAVLGSVLAMDAPAPSLRRCYIGELEYTRPRASLAWADMDENGTPIAYRSQSFDPAISYSTALELAALPSEDGETRYIFTAQNEAGLHVIGRSSALPSTTQFLQWTGAAAEGDAPVVGTISSNEDGELHIQLMTEPALIDENGSTEN